MTEMYISQLNERNEKDGAVLNEALQDLQGMVKNQRKSRKTQPLMERRLPNKKISTKEFIIFAAKSLSAGDLIYVFAISVAVTLLGMLAPFLNKQIFDGIIPSGEVGNLIPIAFVLAAAGIGNIMFSVSKSLVLMRLRDKINIDVQAAILDRTFTMPASFYKEYGAGNLGSRVLTVSRICELLSNTVVGGILSLLFSLVYLVQVFIYAKSLMGICILLIFLNIALQFLGYSATKRFSQKIQPAGVELNGFLYSLINGIQKIKTSGAEKRAFARWAGFFKEASPDQAGKPLIILLMPALSMLVSLGGTLLIYNKAFVSEIPLSDYIAFNVAFGMVSGAISTFSSILPSVASLGPMFKLVKPILETEPEVEDDFRDVDSLTGSIEINNLKFRYSEDSPYIYDGLNLKIKAGEYVAIVGNSGCGKSTLMRLLLGFEKPESGTIFYDQYNLAKINKQSLRQHIGTCLQEKSLFGGSILENITITAPLSTMEDAWEAARLADIADDIEAMPMKMHTLINDSGSGLSGGQRQRVLIARALIGKPSILFMDEATSALDNLSQERVVANLAKTKCTRICIAHRTSTVVSCDRILVLDKGKIIEEGTYDQLMAQKGFFYELSKRQL